MKSEIVYSTGMLSLVFGYHTLLKLKFKDLSELSLSIWFKKQWISAPSNPVADISRFFKQGMPIIEFANGSTHSFDNLICEMFK